MTKHTEFAVIGRDPFGRFDTIRRRLPCDSECAWCGQRARFEYGSEDGNGRQSWDGRYFCSVGCRRDFYGPALLGA